MAIDVFASLSLPFFRHIHLVNVFTSLLLIKPLCHQQSIVFTTLKTSMILESGTVKLQIPSLSPRGNSNATPYAPGTFNCSANDWPTESAFISDLWNTKTVSFCYFLASKAIKTWTRGCCRHVLQLIRSLVSAGVEDPEIVLVSYGGFLHFFT